MNSPSFSPETAEHWFTFHLERAEDSHRLRSWVLSALGLLPGILLGDGGGTVGPIPWLVTVRRIDTGAVVLSFDYRDHGDALQHVASLGERAHSQNFWQFCRDVGIPYALVEDAKPVEL